MDDPASLLRAFMQSGGMSQAQLADEAGVSQATVSRALEKPIVRMGRARRRLFIYIQQRRPPVPEVAASAIVSTWDGSEAHAQALADLILVSGRLWPRLGEE